MTSTVNESASLFLGDYCGESPLWGKEDFWQSPNPDFTVCFLDTIPSWVPSIFLILVCCCRPSIIKVKRKNPMQRKLDLILHVFKQILALLSICCTLTKLALFLHYRRSLEGASDYFASNAPVVNQVVLVSSISLTMLLTNLERYESSRAATAVFFYWLLTFALQLLPLQHHARRSSLVEAAAPQYDLKLTSAVTTYLTAATSFLLLILSCCQNYTSQNDCPFESASIFSRLMGYWIMPLLFKGFKMSLTISDLHNLPKNFKCKYLSQKFHEKYFSPQNKSQSVTKTLISCHAVLLTWLFFLRILFIALELFKPVCLGWLLNHISNRFDNDVEAQNRRSNWLSEGLFYSTLLFLASAIQSFSNNYYWMETKLVGTKIQNTIRAAIFAKSLRITMAARRTSTIGEIVNLMSIDASRYFDGVEMLITGVLTPVQLAIAIWLIYHQIGLSVLSSLAFLLALIPFNVLVSGRIRDKQAENMKLKDSRFKLINEILNGIKMVKFYAWERSFESRVGDLRKEELNLLKRLLYWQAGLSLLFNITPLVVAMLSLTTFVLSSNEVLTAEKAFVSLSLFNTLRLPLWHLPNAITSASQMLVAGRRIGSFLSLDEVPLDAIERDPPEGVAVTLEDASFSWSPKSSAFLNNITFYLLRGEALAIVGAVGAGKSALLQSILGETFKIGGKLVVEENLAYVAQQPWIQNGTVKENILFGKAMESEKYERIVHACALGPDLNVLPAGDETEIGERGINLSGGQKLRVSLARAIYAEADLYLLDDPLSAVDSHVAKHLFENVLATDGLLGGKSRIVVTNNLTYLPFMDNVVFLEEGRMIEKGKYEELILNPSFSSFAKFASKKPENENDKVEIVSRKKIQKKDKTQNGDGKLVTTEEAKRGHVGLLTYVTYLKLMGWPISVGIVIAFVGLRGLELASNAWLSEWTDETNEVLSFVLNETLNSSKIYVNSYDYLHRLIVYDVFNITGSVCLVLAVFLKVNGTLNAAFRLHNSLTARVLAYPLSFFETVPSGRLMNRFSSDMDAVDLKIPETLFMLYSTMIYVVAALVIISIYLPWFLTAIPLILLCFVVLQRIYIGAARQLRRLEAISRSPIFSLFAETNLGVAVIRAFRRQKGFKELCVSLVDENFKVNLLIHGADRWIIISFNLTASFVVFFCSVYAVLNKTITPGVAGLTISYAINITRFLGRFIRSLSEFENNLVSVERIVEYCELPTEAPWKNELSENLVKGWPVGGKIAFRQYCVRYRDNMDLVLKNLTFDVAAGQRVGVVGRTGAGKSSLVLALFRILEASSGRVEIDDLDASLLGLHVLRSNIAVIPQDPVVFAGTLRDNLDPFRLHEDARLWNALRVAHLDAFVRSLPDELDHECVEGGENLSVGQRQLLCLARASLRDAKMLVLDEATSAVDANTDVLVQSTIRREFVGCTVVTVAHRLETVLDYDKVMVLSDGEMVEFEDPTRLLEDESSAFYALAKDAGIVG